MQLWGIETGCGLEGVTKMKAQAYDNRAERKALVLDAACPFVAVKPIGHFKPVIGHYATMKAAKQAAKRWSDCQDA